MKEKTMNELYEGVIILQVEKRVKIVETVVETLY